jgi:hypothetical protein
MLSEIASEILAYLRSTHRTDPAVAVAISELAHAGYVATPDAGAIELTHRGYEALMQGEP